MTMAVLAPIPSASAVTAARVKPELLSSVRNQYLTSLLTSPIRRLRIAGSAEGAPNPRGRFNALRRIVSHQGSIRMGLRSPAFRESSKLVSHPSGRPGRRQISDECFEGISGSLAPLNGSQSSYGCPRPGAGFGQHVFGAEDVPLFRAAVAKKAGLEGARGGGSGAPVDPGDPGAMSAASAGERSQGTCPLCLPRLINIPLEAVCGE